jgi:hypothetical protein
LRDDIMNRSHCDAVSRHAEASNSVKSRLIEIAAFRTADEACHIRPPVAGLRTMTKTNGSKGTSALAFSPKAKPIAQFPRMAVKRLWIQRCDPMVSYLEAKRTHD